MLFIGSHGSENHHKGKTPQNSKTRVVKIVEGEWYSGRVRVYHNQREQSKRTHDYYQSLSWDYKDTEQESKISGNTGTNVDEVQGYGRIYWKWINRTN